MGSWEVHDGREQVGPLPEEQVLRMIEAGLPVTAMVRPAGSEEWKNLRTHAPFAIAIERARAGVQSGPPPAPVGDYTTPGYGPPAPQGYPPAPAYPGAGYGAAAPPKKKAMSPLAIIGIALGVVVMGPCVLCTFAGAVSSAARDKASVGSAAPDDTPPPPRAAPPPAAPRKSADRNVALGEEFKLGEFSYVIKEVTWMKTVGTGYGAKTAGDGAMFNVVHFSIRNDGNETKTVMSDDFRIVDAQGRQFRPSSHANTALIMSGGKDMILSELQPGVKKDSATAFEMPEAVLCEGYDLVIPEKGLFGAGKVVVKGLAAKCKK